MLTLDVRPSKRLFVLYSFIYSSTLIAIFLSAQGWPIVILLLILFCVSIAGIASIFRLCALKKIICLPSGKMELQFKAFSTVYSEIEIRHQGPKLIVLHCKNGEEFYSFLCFYDSFSKEHFGALQRFLKKMGSLT